MREYKAVDISEYQGKVDFAKLKTQVDAVIIRMGYIGNTEWYVDDMFAYYAEQCKKHSIPWGVYVYTYVKTPERMKTSAEWASEVLKKYRPTLPVYLDIEEQSAVSVSNENTLKTVKIFAETMQNAGFAPGVYASTWWHEHYLDSYWYDSISRWVADWGRSCSYNKRVDIWQYTSSGKVDGINGYVDMNIMYFSPVLYDADGDGKVSAADARKVLRASAKLESLSPERTALCDVDSDGKLTAADARKVLRASAGLSEE